MRNRPYNDQTRSAGGAGVRLDYQPRIRLAVLYAVFALPACLIASRLVYLQAVIPDRFQIVQDQTIETLEPIPSRDGRILTADGVVLAYDEPQFDLTVHYGWIVEPSDPGWINDQARARLTSRQRRDAELVEAAREEVLADREALWQTLVATTGVTREEYRRRCAQIQRRVERVHEHVERVREQGRLAESAESSPPRGAESEWWQSGWRLLVDELTTPPNRERIDPLVIREQVDYHRVTEHVSLEVVTAVETLPSRYPGVRVQLSNRRVYAGGDFASHVVGSRTPLTGEEFADRQQSFPEGDPLEYREGDRIGRGGVELAYDSRLHGRPGLRRVVRDRTGIVLNEEIVRSPIHGGDVVLTIGSGLQRRAEELLDAAIPPEPGATAGEMIDDDPVDSPVAQGGCLIALDVRTGRVLAAAAAPRHDLQLITNFDEQRWQALVDDTRRPFFPRVTRMAVPPGSVFKAVSAVALLESGVVHPDAMFFCQGYLNHPHRDRCYVYRHFGHGHGDMNLDSALCQSCNVYFFAAAEQIGPHAISEWALRFGFGRETGSDLGSESPGAVPDPAEASSQQPWYPGTTRQLAIGQASLTVTPLQVARMMAAIANDGYLVTPQFIDHNSGQVTPSSSEHEFQLVGFETESSATSAVHRIPGLSPGTLERVRQGLRLVVQDPRGTGKRVRMVELAIAGKTGTAEVGGGRPDHAWFAGYAPADAPRVAFVAVLEHGGSGGSAAGPLARQFVESMLEFGVLSPDSELAD